MATPPLRDSSGNANDDTGGKPTAGAPLWVKLFGIVLAAVIVLVVILQLTGIGGQHGPGRHLQSHTPSIPTGHSIRLS